MNRRNFIKATAAATALGTLGVGAKTVPEITPQVNPESYYQVNCYVFDYATNSRKDYDDLWTYPEPTFTNIDSAIEFIEDHKKTFDLDLVNVMYDIKFVSPGLYSTVGSSSHNSAGSYQWVDRPPHQNWNHDSF